MPANRRRTEITAPAERWQLLGRLLEARRKELGYTYRSRKSGPSFAADANIDSRMQADFEKAAKDRINRFMPGTLHIIARGYRVTEESVRAVLRGEADELTAAPPAAARSLPAPAADPPGWPAERTAANRPYHDRINERRVELAARGIAYPTGAQMFGDGTEDAEVWDREGAPLPVGNKVWLVADVQRRKTEDAARPEANDRGA